MDLGKDWNKINHAYVSSGQPEDIWQLLQNLGYSKAGNPDAWEIVSETFGVDEARELYGWSVKKPFGEGRKVAVIAAQSITTEAQNALLKLFEEPAPRTHFFLLVNSPQALLPTLLSRVHLLPPEGSETKSKGEEFLHADISKRFKIANPIIKAKDKSRAKSLVHELVRLTRDERVSQAEKYLAGRSPSIKIILEYLATTMLESRYKK